MLCYLHPFKRKSNELLSILSLSPYIRAEVWPLRFTALVLPDIKTVTTEEQYQSHTKGHICGQITRSSRHEQLLTETQGWTWIPVLCPSVVIHSQGKGKISKHDQFKSQAGDHKIWALHMSPKSPPSKYLGNLPWLICSLRPLVAPSRAIKE